MNMRSGNVRYSQLRASPQSLSGGLGQVPVAMLAASMPAAACRQSPADVARGRLGAVLMAHVLRAGHGRDVADRAAGRGQGGG